ncbi:MAG: TIGR01459 family HAD-type hydrolase, partial [Beijerinckiaceae bacterium]
MQQNIMISNGMSSLAPRYDVVFCDIWGVVHDGMRAYAAAGEALARWRSTGATIVLVSNAPLPAARVAQVLDEKGVRRDAWDAIVSSGDVTRAEMTARGGDVFHIGPERDRSVFENLPVTRVPLADAAMVVVTGLVHDSHETAENYRAVLQDCLARDLVLICANPDRVVHVGTQLLPCAGVIADLYESMGGTVVWAGKPYRPIYERALQTAKRLRGAAVAKSRIVMIGDSLKTDVAGARRFG